MVSHKETLLSSGLNASYQRVKILEHLMERRDHPTVSMLHHALIREIPTLARATVYNTLNALVEKGLVTALTIKPEEARYDYKREPHHHFLCKRCGSILDIEIRCTYANAAEVEGHRVEDIHGYFKGTCRHCLRQERHPRAGSRKLTQHTIPKKEDKNG
jgi:Fur family transcriptional regulator, peroxide stress response regulator